MRVVEVKKMAAILVRTEKGLLFFFKRKAGEEGSGDEFLDGLDGLFLKNNNIKKNMKK